jgi:hypothetical protein
MSRHGGWIIVSLLLSICALEESARTNWYAKQIRQATISASLRNRLTRPPSFATWLRVRKATILFFRSTIVSRMKAMTLANWRCRR